MRANPADYELVAPGSLAVVLTLLAAEPGVWAPLAGGTELMVQFNAGRLKARKLVSLHGLPELGGIAVGAEVIRIGAGVTYTAMRGHRELAEILPLLVQAAGWTGSMANQNRGTLGGNVVNASPAADSPPALLVYDAQLELISARGTRTVPYASFHTGYKQTVLAPDELVLAIVVPRPAAGLRQYLRKVGPRNAQAISKVALAAVALIEDGRIVNPRVALASVSHAPFRCVRTEAALAGLALTPALIAAARAALLQEIAPLDDIRSTARYRSQVAANLLGEFLTELLPAQPFDRWNALPDDAAETELLACCGSRAWAADLSVGRPYTSPEALLEAAEAVWLRQPEAEWLQAFACHPRIGERKAATTTYLAHSDAEQTVAQGSLDAVSEALLEGNRRYEEKFGFRYIVFASGRTAPELLGVLNDRLTRTRDQELDEAARQQLLITRLRMRKWFQL